MRHTISIPILLLATVLAPVAAQEEEETPTPITWIGLSQLNPGKSAEDAVGLMLDDKEFMDGLVEDGTILSYGAVVPINHDPDDAWNYAEFVSAESWEKIEAWVGAFMGYVAGLDEATQESRQKRFMEVHAAGSHFDWVVRHIGYVPGGTQPRYFYMAHFTVPPSGGEAVTGLFNDFVTPTLSEMQSAGEMGSIGLYVPELHGDHPFTHVFWYSLPGLASVDKMMTAFEEASGPAENAWAESVFDLETHYDKILMVVHYSGPETIGE